MKEANANFQGSQPKLFLSRLRGMHMYLFVGWIHVTHFLALGLKRSSDPLSKLVRLFWSHVSNSFTWFPESRMSFYRVEKEHICHFHLIVSGWRMCNPKMLFLSTVHSQLYQNLLVMNQSHDEKLMIALIQNLLPVPFKNSACIGPIWMIDSELQGHLMITGWITKNQLQKG